MLDQLPPFVVNVLRLSVWLTILGAVFVPLERLFAVRPSKIFRKEVAIDTFYYFANSLLPGLLLAPPLALAAMAGNSLMPPAVLAAVASWPLWLQMLVAMILAETGFYWGHRWCHKWPVLWRFHAVHHSARHVDFLTNTRAHPVDMVFDRLCGLAPLYVLGLAHPNQASGNLMVVAVAVAVMLWGFVIHANLRWSFGPLGWIVSSPAFHHWHHTKHDHKDHNFASTFPWLDRIFGTYYQPKGEWPAEYGIAEPMPDTLTGQLARPWQPEDDIDPGTGDRTVAR